MKQIHLLLDTFVICYSSTSPSLVSSCVAVTSSLCGGQCTVYHPHTMRCSSLRERVSATQYTKPCDVQGNSHLDSYNKYLMLIFRSSARVWCGVNVRKQG